MENHMVSDSERAVRWWEPLLFAALAGGMGWGIRGQYGHETGAMIAGVLVGLTLVFLLCPNWRSLPAARAVAWGTVAMGIGGTMTYGQTIGLTQNPDMIGNWAALRWGMLGLAIKGGVWIGFAGFFLGMGLGGIRYRPIELLLLMTGLAGVYFLGMALLNAPFDPANKLLPSVYFSESWHLKPDAVLKPRREYWGGNLLALAAACAYAGWWRKDRLAPRLALWGVLGGALGFPGGQCLQAFHSWNPEVFHQGIWVRLDPFMNWWNMMETTFGAIMGGVLGLGLWLNRKRIQPGPDADMAGLSGPAEWILLAVFLGTLIAIEFASVPAVEMLFDVGILMTIIPIAAVAGGRWWPYLMALPVTLLPIAGKTVQQLVYQETTINPAAGWFVYFILPLSLATVAAIRFAQGAPAGQTGREFARRALLLTTWIYFSLNFAFFRFPWPWAEWTGRTPNAIIFTLCAIGLTVLALKRTLREKHAS